MSETWDVVVIGGGMAGASIAYELAGESRVLLLEGESMLAAHSTGRSAAMYLPSYGGDVVRALTVASGPIFDSLAEQWGDTHPLTPRELLWTAFDDESDAALTSILAAQEGSVDKLDAPAALAKSALLKPETLRWCVLDGGGQDIDVLAVHQMYVRGFKSRGGTTRTGARVTGLERTGDAWRITTASETVEAGLVIDAAGAWADAIAEMAGARPLGLVPKRRTLFLSPASVPVDPHGPTIGDPAERWYFKPEGDGILASPADADPVDAGDAKASELNIARAMEEINDATTLGLRTVRRSWGGLRTFAPDGAPVAGLVPDLPGFGFLAGQGGYGIQMAPALAVAAAALLTGNAIPDTIPVSAEDLGPQRLWAA
ncbi:NAD(P)/FAD-dependent oxidoreductase [Lolliginicoccus suaedae]|uniref:NAD(P)/FAD-dependent oxidoreductase n=1 Tax=Lolliginicoccus suaedae TaxID=2605429 RepID=UPI001659825A|nr:FAD-binding oxidoreductase [Lolliginicoccus suaedae]